MDNATQDPQGESTKPLNTADARVLYVSDEMSLEDLKRKAKNHNATVNDWFMACVTKAVNEFY